MTDQWAGSPEPPSRKENPGPYTSTLPAHTRVLRDETDEPFLVQWCRAWDGVIAKCREAIFAPVDQDAVDIVEAALWDVREILELKRALDGEREP